ncbi:transketolase [Fusibacter tunisiensis]|uniref:Transketolase n=1 Tax=Fusibacter tunisiensis TaxID=1008308 RepID=A0ABS2MT34_9FIRM|nr:transketolase [Fusibacter tunisiensis]MBM7562581.1 transketolase [Fusibacter tunisiensis]
MMDLKAINAIRVLSAEAIQAANSGHPGLPLGAAPMAYTLWSKEMRHNPHNPDWHNRDRFVLSAGHGSMMIYALLNLFDYGLSMADIKNFRQLNSKTPGHPEYGHTKGIEISTGPLGQGVANAVGFAMAEAKLAAHFNRPEFPVVDHHTFALSGDGCLMEGISYEAASLAGTLKLGKLILLYDSNRITIEGSTDLAFDEDVSKRFEAMHWQVLEVEDGNDVEAIQKAIQDAKAETDKPSLIVVKTVIGFGCASKQGSHKVHGSPLGDDGIKELKAFANWEGTEAFDVPSELRTYMENQVAALSKSETEWNDLFKAYEKAYPELAKEYKKWFDNKAPMAYLDSEEFWSYQESTASRSSSGKVLNNLADVMPNLFGGSADLSPSNNSDIKGKPSFHPGSYDGVNLHFGVREHAMAAIVNGIQAHGGLRAYAATFFVFSDYMKPAMRLAALMNLPVTYILTHDSIGVGEDGPTHQPVDQLAMLRAVPNLQVVRPADAREVSAAWYMAMTSKSRPTALVLTRQKLEALEGSSKEALKGAYIVSPEQNKLDAILLATGSEVALAVDAQKQLRMNGMDTRVVSMPCMEIFEDQEQSYKNRILPKDTPTLAIEAGSPFGWHKYADDVVAQEGFGLSAPGDTLFDYFGFTVDNVVSSVKKML